MSEDRGIRCRACNCGHFRTVWVRHRVGGVVRKRECRACGKRQLTREKASGTSDMKPISQPVERAEEPPAKPPRRSGRQKGQTPNRQPSVPCVACQGRTNRVVRARATAQAIRRLRECLGCKRRFWTVEQRSSEIGFAALVKALELTPSFRPPAAKSEQEARQCSNPTNE